MIRQPPQAALAGVFSARKSILMTEELFRRDAYLKECEATIVGIDEGGIRLDRTVFYPMGGGQPGDSGELELASGAIVAITDTRKDESSTSIVHTPGEAVDPGLVGEPVTARIDWDRRHRLMRVHTLLHLLCAVVPAGVTGGSIRDDGTGRLDFDLP